MLFLITSLAVSLQSGMLTSALSGCCPHSFLVRVFILSFWMPWWISGRLLSWAAGATRATSLLPAAGIGFGGWDFPSLGFALAVRCERTCGLDLQGNPVELSGQCRCGKLRWRGTWRLGKLPRHLWWNCFLVSWEGRPDRSPLFLCSFACTLAEVQCIDSKVAYTSEGFHSSSYFNKRAFVSAQSSS